MVEGCGACYFIKSVFGIFFRVQICLTFFDQVMMNHEVIIEQVCCLVSLHDGIVFEVEILELFGAGEKDSNACNGDVE